MPTISGPIATVSGLTQPVQHARLYLEAARPDGDGIVTSFPETLPVTGGTLTFECVEGPAVLELVSAGSRPDRVPILVGKDPEQTLASVAQAAALADGHTQGQLAEIVDSIRRERAASQQAAATTADALNAVTAARDATFTARDEAVSAGETATGARNTTITARDATLTARDATLTARNEAEGFKAQASTSAQAAGEDAAAAQLAESGAGTARDQAQTLVSEANSALQQALDVIADAESLQDVQTALANVDGRINAAITDLVGTAPEHLDTLGELATAVEGLDPALRDLIAERLALADVAVDVLANKVVRRNSTGDVLVPATPSGDTSAVAKAWVQAQLTQGLAGKANATHTHSQYATTAQVDGVSGRVTTLENSAPIIVPVEELPANPNPTTFYAVMGPGVVPEPATLAVYQMVGTPAAGQDFPGTAKPTTFGFVSNPGSWYAGSTHGLTPPVAGTYTVKVTASPANGPVKIYPYVNGGWADSIAGTGDTATATLQLTPSDAVYYDVVPTTGGVPVTITIKMYAGAV